MTEFVLLGLAGLLSLTLVVRELQFQQEEEQDRLRARLERTD